MQESCLRKCGRPIHLQLRSRPLSPRLPSVRSCNLTEAAWYANAVCHDWACPQAAFPAAWVRQSKFWPAVKRIDDVYGDRHLVSTIQVLRLRQHCAEKLTGAAASRSHTSGQKSPDGSGVRHPGRVGGFVQCQLFLV